MTKQERTCTIAGCGRKHSAHGLCGSHYWRMRKGKDLTPPLQVQHPGRLQPFCRIEGCGRPYLSRGMCGAHYMRWREGRDLHTPVRQYNVPPDEFCNEPGCSELRGSKRGAALYSYCLEHERRRHVLREYGLSFDDYDRLLAAQNGGCAVCGKKNPGFGKGILHIDHDHGTGEVRGLLCQQCNQAIGLLQDDAEVIFKAACYIENYRLNSQGTQK